MRAGMSYFHETIWKGAPKFLRRVDTALKNVGINERVPFTSRIRFIFPYNSPSKDVRKCKVQEYNFLFFMGYENIILETVPPNESCRVILGDVRDKLNNTRERSRQLLANGKSDIPENSIFTNAEQVPSLPITFSSRKFKFSIPVLLQSYKMEIHCYDGSLLDFLRQVSTFGLSLVRLDIRQESDRDTDISGCHHKALRQWILSRMV
ncbi:PHOSPHOENOLPYRUVATE CARBOXYLASE [Salix purpurea]|uniref:PHOSPHOENOLPYRUVATE CARBOXYLASE n=1 Tax=Salix purpurea TaxID=77065 RepID=A0A9Q0SR50_SALPP|nr:PHOSPHOENOLPYRUVATE CARBOXYLASE [Salix purpurea]